MALRLSLPRHVRARRHPELQRFAKEIQPLREPPRDHRAPSSPPPSQPAPVAWPHRAVPPSPRAGFDTRPSLPRPALDAAAGLAGLGGARLGLGGAGVGPTLRAAREAAQLSVDALCHQTRMSRAVVEAIEAERWADLPGDFYARGFLRLYAERVALDGDRIVEAFDAGRRLAFDEDLPAPALAPSWQERPRAGRGPSPAQLFMLVVTVATIVVFMLSAQRRKAPTKVAAKPVVTSPVSGATAASPALPGDAAADAGAAATR